LISIIGQPGAGINFISQVWLNTNSIKKIYIFCQDSNEYYNVSEFYFNEFDHKLKSFYEIQESKEFSNDKINQTLLEHEKWIKDIQSFKSSLICPNKILLSHYPPYYLIKLNLCKNDSLDSQIYIKVNNCKFVNFLVFLKKDICTRIYSIYNIKETGSIMNNSKYYIEKIINGILPIIANSGMTMEFFKKSLNIISPDLHLTGLSKQYIDLIEGSNLSVLYIFYCNLHNIKVSDTTFIEFLQHYFVLHPSPNGFENISKKYEEYIDVTHKWFLQSSTILYDDLFFNLNLNTNLLFFKNLDIKTIYNYSLKNLLLMEKYFPIFKNIERFNKVYEDVRLYKEKLLSHNI